MSVPMTLSDLERRGHQGQIFLADLLNKLVPERPNSISAG